VPHALLPTLHTFQLFCSSKGLGDYVYRLALPVFCLSADQVAIFRRSSDGWAMFDTMVVSVSVFLLFVDGGGQGGNSWIKQLRVLRAFRLLRLLGKMGDLKKIVAAVAMSLLPTLQALVRKFTLPCPVPTYVNGIQMQDLSL
jgi:hypothetical protein